MRLPAVSDCRSNFMWSHCLGRFLIPCEALWAMGVQTEVSEGGAIDFHSSGMSKHTGFYELAGNGMHAPTLGAILTWFMAVCGKCGQSARD